MDQTDVLRNLTAPMAHSREPSCSGSSSRQIIARTKSDRNRQETVNGTPPAGGGSLSSTGSSSGCSSLVECYSLEAPTCQAEDKQESAPALEETDFLEVNELLYLQTNRATRSSPTDHGHVERLLPVGPTMSEFSAFTLRKSLKVRSSSGSRAQQAAYRSAASARLSRESIAAASGPLAPPARPLKRVATVAPFVGVAQRQLARRSLPVPPPVVPLYKEERLARPLEGGAPGQEAPPVPSRPGWLGEGPLQQAGGCEVGSSPGPESQGSRITVALTTTSSVNILAAATNDNNNNGSDKNEQRSTVEAPGNGSADCDKLATVADVDEPPREGFQCGAWEDLRAPSRRVGTEESPGEGACGLRSLGSELAARGGGAEWAEAASGSPAVGGFGSTLGRRTGKLLERLRCAFLARSNSGASANNDETGHQDNNNNNNTKPEAESSSSAAPVPSASITRQRPGEEPAGPDLYIYDTPEFGSRPSAASNQNRHSVRPAIRPSIPPPPPPPPPLPPLPAVTTLFRVVRAPHAHDCAGGLHPTRPDTRDPDAAQSAQRNLHRVQRLGASSTCSSNSTKTTTTTTHNSITDPPSAGGKLSAQATREQRAILATRLDPRRRRQPEEQVRRGAVEEKDTDRKQTCSSQVRAPAVKPSSQVARPKVVKWALEDEQRTKRRTAEELSESVVGPAPEVASYAPQQQQRIANLCLAHSRPRIRIARQRGQPLEEETVVLEPETVGYQESDRKSLSTRPKAATGEPEVQATKVESRRSSCTNYTYRRILKSLSSNQGQQTGCQYCHTCHEEDVNHFTTDGKAPTRADTVKPHKMGASHSAAPATPRSPTCTRRTEETKAPTREQTECQTSAGAKRDTGKARLRPTFAIKLGKEDHGNKVSGDALLGKAHRSHKQQQQTQTQRFGGGAAAGRQATVKAKSPRASPDLMRLPQMDERSIFELRRKSIQDGDVFIYPTLYKNLNECQRCSRDNKICNCNSLLEPEVHAQPQQSDRPGEKRTKKACSSQPQLSKRTQLVGNGLAAEKQQEQKSIAGSESRNAISDRREISQEQQQQQRESKSNEEQMKTVYRISISTAAIDQKNNQVILSTPKVIGQSGQQPRDDHGAAATAPSIPPRLGDGGRTIPDSVSSTPNGQSNMKPVTEDSCSSRRAIISESCQVAELKRASGAIDSEKAQAHSSTDDQLAQQSFGANNCRAENETGKLLLLSSNQENYPQSEILNKSQRGGGISAKITAISLESPERPQLKDNRELLSQKNCKALDLNNNYVNSSLENPCDKIRGTGRSSASIMDQLIEQECDNEEQLTCKLNLGDSIKITSTSIRIPATSSMQQDGSALGGQTATNDGDSKSHTSIVPIQTLSNRRRNLASKLSRQAIHEDSIADSQVKISEVSTSDVNRPLALIEQQTGERKQNQVKEIDGRVQEQESPSSDALEYSPILTSVRDYIKNVNTELQVQSPSLIGGECSEFPAIRAARNSILDPVEGSMLINGSPIIAISEGGSALTPTTIVTSTTGAITIASSSMVTTTGIITSTSTFSTGNASTSPNGGLLIHSVPSCGEHSGESPKKSIFEGASKDEILEYLEDARERVPEILMAADDVMVINENELIVVNQLEPGSPATPISIVEATEVMGSTEGSLLPVVDSSQLLAAVSPLAPEPIVELHHPQAEVSTAPDQLRLRLQQIYQSSQMTNVSAGNSQFSSGNNTMDEDTGISSSELHSGLNSNIGSIMSSMDNPTTPTDMKIDNLSLDVPVYQLNVSTTNNLKDPKDLTPYIDENTHNSEGIGLSTRKAAEKMLDSTTNCTSLFATANHHMNSKEQVGVKLPVVDDTAVRTISALHYPPHQQEPNAMRSTSQNQRAMDGNFPMRGLHFGSATRRRNSTSSDGSGRATSGGGVVQMLRLQQRYTNRDSLSSPSTSPPSSASPSSSTGSNATSGNCSAASTFYASSSLSCSSPLLAMAPSTGSNQNNNSRAFSARQTDYLTAAQPQSSRYPDLNDSAQSNSSFGKVISSASPDAMVDSQLLSPVERDDSGLGSDSSDRNKAMISFYSSKSNLEPQISSSSLDASNVILNQSTKTVSNQTESIEQIKQLSASHSLGLNPPCPEFDAQVRPNKNSNVTIGQVGLISNNTVNKLSAQPIMATSSTGSKQTSYSSSMVRFSTASNATLTATSSSPTFSSSANLMSRSVHGHYATMNRLNNYFMSRNNENTDTTIEFQCLDCDQFIDVDHATMLHKSNEFRLLRETDRLETKFAEQMGLKGENVKEKLMTSDQLDRAYIAAMNGLPLCSSCEKKRIERKEIISEFVETELKYGRDLKIIHDEFYRPMQIAGLLSKDQIIGVFLNLEELIVVHCKFAMRLEAALRDAHSMGDTDFNTINIGRLFVESAEMLHAFESYCIRQGSAACLLARLAKEKELLRIFLRVSQMENTLLRRMNLAAFLMVPVQRVTKYPLLLNRLYKVTAYHHKDREVLRDAQLKVELHLEHINQQTKGVGATNKIWRRISNLSAPISNRRGLINAEDIGYIKLRKTAMDMLKWDRDETQFIHSGRLNFAPLNEFLIKQKMKPLRYMAAHALLIVLGKPNWKYRPDLVKSNLDNKLMTPTPGGNGVKEAALLLFREKGGRFIPCREPLFLSNCVLSADCSQYNSECPIPNNHHNQKISVTSATTTTTNSTAGQMTQSGNNCSTTNGGSSGHSNTANPCFTNNLGLISTNTCESNRVDSKDRSVSTDSNTSLMDVLRVHRERPEMADLRANSGHSDTLSMASVKSLPENHVDVIAPPAHTSRSYSLASALPRTTVSATSSSSSLTKSSSITASNLTIINQLMTKVNSYSHKQQQQQQQQQQLVTMAANGASSKGVVAEQTKIQTTTSASVSVENSIGCSSQSQLASNDSTQSNVMNNSGNNNNRSASNQSGQNRNIAQNEMIHPQHYNHLFFNNHHHHQPYGDYEESFEIHERLSKESMLLRADTTLKTRYWLQMLRYHAKDLGQWRARRNGLANIMMMRHE